MTNPVVRLWNRVRRNRKAVRTGGAVVLVLVLLVGGRILYDRLTTNRISAFFTSTTGLYVGDDVRVLGVPVGKVTAIAPGPESARVAMSVDSSVAIPADARAVIVAPTLVTGRFIQLAPRYRDGPKLGDGGSIPVQHTAVPVEWDNIKTELNKLSDVLGPTGADPQGSLGRAVNTAAANLDNGNAVSMHDTLVQLSKTMSILSDGRADLFTTIRNLQVFVTALSNSNTQIVEFGGRLASVSRVLSDSATELGVALTSLDAALGQVKGFVAANTGELSDDVARLADATQVLVDKRPEIEQVLHIAPTALENFYQIYQPAQGVLVGELPFNEFMNMEALICDEVRDSGTNDPDRSANLCRQYLGPVLNTLNFNYPPFGANPVTGQKVFPNQIYYSPPALAQTAAPRNLGALMAPGGGR